MKTYSTLYVDPLNHHTYTGRVKAPSKRKAVQRSQVRGLSEVIEGPLLGSLPSRSWVELKELRGRNSRLERLHYLVYLSHLGVSMYGKRMGLIALADGGFLHEYVHYMLGLTTDKGVLDRVDQAVFRLEKAVYLK
jgi:hypothetical protein